MISEQEWTCKGRRLQRSNPCSPPPVRREPCPPMLGPVCIVLSGRGEVGTFGDVHDLVLIKQCRHTRHELGPLKCSEWRVGARTASSLERATAAGMVYTAGPRQALCRGCYPGCASLPADGPVGLDLAFRAASRHERHLNAGSGRRHSSHHRRTPHSVLTLTVTLRGNGL